MKKALMLFLSILLLTGCSKNDEENSSDQVIPPQVNITSVDSITEFSAQLSINITNASNFSISDKGVCWGTTPNPSLGDTCISMGSGSASFMVELSGLDPNMNYFVRGYVTTAAGTSYSEAVNFQTDEYVSCGIYEGHVVLQTQEEVEAFGECRYTGITGSLHIYNYGIGNQVTDLSPLSTLQSVGYLLNIHQNDSLQDLTGLENITSCDALYIFENPSLENLDALSNLQTNSVTINELPLLTSIDGLVGIDPIMERLDIAECPLITDLNALSHVTEVKTFLIIRENAQLQDLSGLESLTTVGTEANPSGCCSGAFRIGGNENLTSFNGLNQLTTVHNGLEIQGNDLLTDLSSFPALTDFQGNLVINYNESLANIDGLSFVTTANYVSIYGNPTLLNIDGLSNLGSITSDLSIIENTSLTDLCGITYLLEQGPLCCNYYVGGNAYNPSESDILNGDCSL